MSFFNENAKRQMSDWYVKLERFVITLFKWGIAIFLIWYILLDPIFSPSEDTGFDPYDTEWHKRYGR